jgi:hypothetical protein
VSRRFGAWEVSGVKNHQKAGVNRATTYVVIEALMKKRPEPLLGFLRKILQKNNGGGRSARSIL